MVGKKSKRIVPVKNSQCFGFEMHREEKSLHLRADWGIRVTRKYKGAIFQTVPTSTLVAMQGAGFRIAAELLQTGLLDML